MPIILNKEHLNFNGLDASSFIRVTSESPEDLEGDMVKADLGAAGTPGEEVTMEPSVSIVDFHSKGYSTFWAKDENTTINAVNFILSELRKTGVSSSQVVALPSPNTVYDPSLLIGGCNHFNVLNTLFDFTDLRLGTMAKFNHEIDDVPNIGARTRLSHLNEEEGHYMVVHDLVVTPTVPGSVPVNGLGRAALGGVNNDGAANNEVAWDKWLFLEDVDIQAKHIASRIPIGQSHIHDFEFGEWGDYLCLVGDKALLEKIELAQGKHFSGTGNQVFSFTTANTGAIVFRHPQQFFQLVNYSPVITWPFKVPDTALVGEPDIRLMVLYKPFDIDNPGNTIGYQLTVSLKSDNFIDLSLDSILGDGTIGTNFGSVADFVAWDADYWIYPRLEINQGDPSNTIVASIAVNAEAVDPSYFLTDQAIQGIDNMSPDEINKAYFCQIGIDLNEVGETWLFDDIYTEAA